MRFAALRRVALAVAVLAAAPTLSFPDAVAAQEPATGQVLGTVRDAGSGQPLAGADVALLLASDSSVVRTGVTNAAGRLLFTGVAPDRYVVRISSLAYETVLTSPFDLAPGAQHNVGVLGLAVEALELEAIDVTTDRPVVTFEPDRTSYDVTAMPGAEGVAVSDLFRGMPELEVDLDGQVTMRGARTQIYIDGRPAPMNGQSLTAFLEQFPAENIERVEIIDNPSARYRAEGSGGIVNIVLREGVEIGLTGVAFLNAGTRGQLGGGVRGTLQRGPWTFNSGLNVNRSDRESSGFDLRQNLIADPTNFVQQDSWSSRDGYSGNLDLEVRYQPTDRLRLWVGGRVNASDDSSEGLTTTTRMDELRSPTSIYRRASALDGGGVSGRFQTGLTYEWERRRHELEIELDVDRSRQDEETWEELEEIMASDPDELPADLTFEDEREREGEITFEVDYTRPWTEEGRFEVGYHLDASDTGSDRLLRLTQSGTPAESQLGFDHAQTFHALYLTLQRQLGLFGVQVGLRGERADTRFETPDGQVFENDYYSLFPSASLSARIDQQRQIRLSYSRRIGRPDSNVLNPIDRSTDPLNRRVGNPYVEPEYTHSVSLDVSWNTPLGRLGLAPYYRRSENGWAQITQVDENGVSTRTWDNVASEERYGASLTAWMRRGGRVSGFVSLEGSRQVQDATNLSEDFRSSAFRWRTRMNLEGSVTDDFAVEGRFSYTPPVDMPQGRSDGRFSTDFGFRYRLFDRRASLRMSFEDPLGLQESSFETRDPTHVQIGRSTETTRSIRLSLSYTFGGQGAFRGGGGGRGGGRRGGE